MFNIVTIAREYGSGGAAIGRMVAELLNWQLVDKEIIAKAAAMGEVDPSWAENADERTCAWWERVLRGFRHGGPELYLGGGMDMEMGHDMLQEFTAQVIREAGKQGNCVIVGRGSQCVLRNEPRALNVMVYAPMMEKLNRVKNRHLHESDLQALLRSMDSERAHYTRDYYGCDWSDRGLYQLCVNSTLGLDACAKLIVSAIRLSGTQERPEKKETPALQRG
ncbi:MAG TPA: cytidylate kinase-like family protein [Candidatus Saccharimonadales bacterium]|nr:cytidylate kinase-like family protein [Candidatus Saccharimonadales bacterium]